MPTVNSEDFTVKHVQLEIKKLMLASTKVLSKELKSAKSKVHYASGSGKLVGGIASTVFGIGLIVASGGWGAPAVLGTMETILGPTQAGIGAAEMITTAKGNLDAVDKLMKYGSAPGIIGHTMDEIVGREKLHILLEDGETIQI